MSAVRSCSARLGRYLATETPVKYPSVFTPETVTSVLMRAQAADVVVMDVREKCDYTDYFVLATAQSIRHIDRLGKAVLFTLKEEMRKSNVMELSRDLPPELQGDSSSEWMVIDAGSILVHLMTESKRRFLDLQTLWEEQGTSVESTDHQVILTKDTITSEPQDH